MVDALIPFWDPGDTITCHAEAALVSKRFVALSGPRVDDNPQVSPATAAGRVFGIAGEDTAIATKGTVFREGVLPITIGAAVSAGDLLQVGTAGKAITRTTGVAVAVALDDGADDGDDVPCVLITGGDGGASLVQADAIVSLTDNSAGTADNTLQALADGTTYATDVAAIRNNFADLAAKVNAIIAELRQAGVIAT